MDGYRLAWQCFGYAFGVVGAVLAVIFLPLGAVAAIAVCAAAAGAAVPCFRARGPGRPTVPISRLGASAARGAGVGVAFAGMLATTGGTVAVGLLALLAAGSPPAVRFYTTHLSSTSAAVPQHLDLLATETRLDTGTGATIDPTAVDSNAVDGAVVDVAALRDLSDEQLCWAWRCSFTTLQRARHSQERIRVTGVRAAYLDELCRRDPDGFTRWMDAGARAASDPTRYLTPATERSRRQSA